MLEAEVIAEESALFSGVSNLQYFSMILKPEYIVKKCNYKYI